MCGALDSNCRSACGNRRRPPGVNAATQLAGRNSASLNFFINFARSARDDPPPCAHMRRQQLPPNKEFRAARQITAARSAPRRIMRLASLPQFVPCCNELIQGCFAPERRTAGARPTAGGRSGCGFFLTISDIRVLRGGACGARLINRFKLFQMRRALIASSSKAARREVRLLP